jgi:hypothetical protein
MSQSIVSVEEYAKDDTGVFFALLFNPNDGGEMFLQNSG